MAKKPSGGVPSDRLALYEKLVATHPDVERKGASMPYTSLNGNMFSFLTPEGTLALRLPSDEREAFLKRFKTQLCQQHGRVMQEYVEVPDSLLTKTATLTAYFAKSVAYVRSLTPKAMTRPKNSASATRNASSKRAAKK